MLLPIYATANEAGRKELVAYLYNHPMLEEAMNYNMGLVESYDDEDGGDDIRKDFWYTEWATKKKKNYMFIWDMINASAPKAPTAKAPKQPFSSDMIGHSKYELPHIIKCSEALVISAIKELEGKKKSNEQLQKLYEALEEAATQKKGYELRKHWTRAVQAYLRPENADRDVELAAKLLSPLFPTANENGWKQFIRYVHRPPGLEDKMKDIMNSLEKEPTKEDPKETDWVKAGNNFNFIEEMIRAEIPPRKEA